MDKTLLDFVMIASVIIGYFVGTALITTSFYKSRANNYLSLSLFLISSLTLLEWYSNTPHIVFEILSNFRLDLLFAVILFSYFLIQIKHNFLNNSWYKWMYLPFLICVILEIPIYFLNLYDSFLYILVFLIKDFGSIGFNIFLIFSGRYLIKNATSISDDKRHWLLRLNLFIICIILSWVLTRIEFYTFNTLYTLYILWILLSLLSWWILYYGVFTLQLIDQKEEMHDYLVANKTSITQTKKKIKSSTTSKIIIQLYTLMEDEELFKNPFLSRLDLATRLGTSEGYLSQIINQEINKSIIQFVNEYRIESAKNLLHNSMFNKYSVEAIGLEVGFKSKSAFYRAFNTSLNMSPGAYKKLQKTS